MGGGQTRRVREGLDGHAAVHSARARGDVMSLPSGRVARHPSSHEGALMTPISTVPPSVLSRSLLERSIIPSCRNHMARRPFLHRARIALQSRRAVPWGASALARLSCQPWGAPPGL